MQGASSGERTEGTALVTVVVVAYNRASLLRETLTALAGQSRLPQRVIVVNNASKDETETVVRSCFTQASFEGQLICLSRNTGGAGGFAVGIAAALQAAPCDWIWVMDDDTVPDRTALEEALLAHERYCAAGPDSIAIMGSAVYWTDGSQHPMNTPKQKIRARTTERVQAQKSETMAIRSISFVSAFVRAARAHELGLPIADYFLWNDDFEYSARLIRGARGIFVPDSTVVHKTRAKVSSDQDPGERFYFEVRNKLWVFLRSSALAPWERVLYAGASVRRWARTFAASKNRALLFRCLVRGVRDGFFSRPRPNSVALEDAQVPHEIMRVIERFERKQKRASKDVRESENEWVEKW